MSALQHFASVGSHRGCGIPSPGAGGAAEPGCAGPSTSCALQHQSRRGERSDTNFGFEALFEGVLLDFELFFRAIHGVFFMGHIKFCASCEC